MVSDVQLRQVPPPSEALRQRVLRAVLALRDADFLLPGIAPGNVRTDGERLSVRGFGGCARVSADSVEVAGRLAAGWLRGQAPVFVGAARDLGVGARAAARAFAAGRWPGRAIVAENAEFAVAGAELIGGLVAHAAAVAGPNAADRMALPRLIAAALRL
jgi:hypothetical protein